MKNKILVKRIGDLLLLIIMILGGVRCSQAQTIKLDPKNPHYFLWRGKPTVLVASTEHYGSVINLDFNYDKYLATLKRIGLNHTRVFAGDYVESSNAFCLVHNPLAPGAGRFICPWARSDKPGYILGGDKFDLNKWDPAYFRRLHDFMQKASDNGIVVEFVLFFVGPSWQNAPLNPHNNINGTTPINKSQYLTLHNGNILKYQEAYCKKLVQELNPYDNVIFNIANEPWFNNQLHPGFASPPSKDTKEWIQRVSEWIVNEEKKLPNKHIISVDYTNEGAPITRHDLDTYFKYISVFNHHYDSAAMSLKLNYRKVDRALSFNETGFMPVDSVGYRTQGWQYMMNGGALYDNLDFTFQVGYEDGSGHQTYSCNWYVGSASSETKYQMKALLQFMDSIDFENMHPDSSFIQTIPQTSACALADPGKEYAIYLRGKGPIKVNLKLPDGKYRVEWIVPATDFVTKSNIVNSVNGVLKVSSPNFLIDMAIKVKRVWQE